MRRAGRSLGLVQHWKVARRWPPGHSVRTVKDAELVLFSPQREHTDVMNHMLKALKG